MSMLSGLVRENRFTPDGVPRFESKLFFEGVRRRPHLEQFFVLLGLSVVIATAGILGDSTATVIGAMIVAPLMTPIMATAAALVTGQVPRALRSIALVLIGMAVVVGLSYVMGWLYRGAISFDTNSQIVARTSPRVLDLIAALASGAAGAFCMSREDVSDSLPGVAIAISLVPPLCVVGVSLANGETASATGALLLFVTNALAILLAGGGILLLLGLSGASTAELRGNARRNAFIAVIIAVLVISIPLLATGVRVTHQSHDQIQTQQAADNWATSIGWRVRAVEVVDDRATITAASPGDTPSVEPLAAAIRAAVGHPITVELESIPSTIQVIGP
jgi:uncharacterized hydrophobic protein (TIGR00271 family)